MDNSPSGKAFLPPFSQVHPEEIEGKLEALLNSNREKLSQLLSQSSYTWDNLLLGLEEMNDELNNMWSTIRHLHAVKSTDPLRQAYVKCLSKLSDYSTELSQNEDLYKAVKSIAFGSEFDKLSAAQKKVISNKLRDFRLSGVHLDAQKKKRFAEIEKRLTELTTKFEEHVLDATHAWTYLVTDIQQLAGLPQSAISAAQFEAQQRQEDGWIFTLEMPSYIAVMTHADYRPLREQMYYAFSTRASDQGPNAGKWDNQPVMEEILSLRQELANLLDYKNYAELSLATKMASSVDQVLDFLEQLAEATYPQAKAEFQELSEYAKKTHDLKKLEAWDVAYYSEKLRQHAFNISEEELRPYFPADRALQGLFEVAQRLFNIRIEREENKEVWHPDVRFFAVKDLDGMVRGYFYVDLFSRRQKREGAWMDESRVRRLKKNGELQLPVCFLTCNFEKPVGDKPALLTHDDVITLFHEFGHGLQHLLTKINHADVSGINGVPWDAVELASQFMENYCWQYDSLKLFAKHVETEEPFPESLFERLHRAKNFQSAMDMMRQLIFAMFDFNLHLNYRADGSNQIAKVLQQVREKWLITPIPEYNRFQNTFGHIFAGGYAAGYYSYKWAEVLACDAFSKFEEKGIFDPQSGKEFLEIFLETGGVEEPAILFEQFRGRPPEVNALLKQNGIIT
jgi:oligopeptidase A